MSNKHTYKRVIWVLCCIALFMPMFQTATGLFKVRMLFGDYVVPDAPNFTINGWLEGDFTQQFEGYTETHVGFRKFFIRLRNSFRYSALYQSNRQVVLGKENHLYEKRYIKAYYGQDFIGADSIHRIVQQIQEVKDTLAKQGIPLLVVITPGKASFFPDQIPFEFSRGQKENPLNYLAYQKALTQSSIPFIDMRSWFMQMKDSSQYPLFTRLGIHWTVYGSLLAADSLIHYMENLMAYPIGRATWNKVELTTKYRLSDADLMEIMNTLSDIKSDTLAYPVVQFHHEPKIAKPTVLAVGDSYYWNLVQDSIPYHLFADSSHFWFYNEKVYTNDQKMRYLVDKSKLREEIQRHQVVVIFCNEANLYRFPFGFVNDLYQVYCAPKP